MADWDELRRQQEENLKKEQEKEKQAQEEKMRQDEILQRKKSSQDKPAEDSQTEKMPKKGPKAVAHAAPLYPCPRCRRTHRKGEGCKGP